MNKLKIFVDCHVFDKGYQGSRSYIQGLYLELIKNKNYNFYFAACNIENLKSIFGTSENVFYIKYKTNKSIYRLLFNIPWLIKKHRIDFAHFQYRVAPLKLCKYIVTTHDVLFEDFPEYFPKFNRFQNFWTYKISAKASDIVLTVSEYSKNKIVEHLGINKVYVTPNGIDSIYFMEYDKESVQKKIHDTYGINNYIIYISRWEPRKNHQLILKNYTELKLYNKFSLVFIGEQTLKNKEFEILYDNLSDLIKSKIHIFRRMDFDEMLLFLRGAKLSIYPSKAEGFGIPPLEAVATKTPTICSNVSAMKDFDFFEEYSFNPNENSSFKKALDKIIEKGDVDIIKKSNIIKERYNWKIATTIYLNALENFTDF